MKISLISAVGSKGQIGLDNKIPWHLPEDLKKFKQFNCKRLIRLLGRSPTGSGNATIK